MLVSVITINYNNLSGLKKTIDSVRNQTFDDFESIIVDGNSSDGAKEYLANLDFQNCIWVSEPDKGIYNAMNKGVLMAHGDYCIFMNSGDSFYNDEVLTNIEEDLKKGADVVNGSGYSPRGFWPSVSADRLSLSFFLKDSFNHQSTFVKRQLLLDNPFNESLKIVADTEQLFRLLILNNCSYLQSDVIVSVTEEAGASGNLAKSLEERYKAIKKLLPSRLSYDVDFITNYHNNVILKFGKFLRRFINLFR